MQVLLRVQKSCPPRFSSRCRSIFATAIVCDCSYKQTASASAASWVRTFTAGALLSTEVLLQVKIHFYDGDHLRQTNCKHCCSFLAPYIHSCQRRFSPRRSPSARTRPSARKRGGAVLNALCSRGSLNAFESKRRRRSARESAFSRRGVRGGLERAEAVLLRPASKRSSCNLNDFERPELQSGRQLRLKLRPFG